MSKYISGNLLIIGGAEDKEKECKILKHFVGEAGGPESRIKVITAATSSGEETGRVYEDVFHRLGCTSVEMINIWERDQANSESILKKIKGATGIFFTGGDQLRLTGMLGGTPLGRALEDLYEQKVIIAGTSAGASAMSDTMIIGGRADTPGEDSTKMAPGLGLLKGVIIDQHFAQRGRIGRLLTAVAMNPYVLGLGIDEDTAVHVKGNGKFEVLGRGTVLVVDASQASVSNVDELFTDRPLALAPVKVHVLCEGFEFDISRRVSGKKT